MSSAAGNWNSSYYLETQLFSEKGVKEETKLQTDERSLFSYAVHEINLALGPYRW